MHESIIISLEIYVKVINEELLYTSRIRQIHDEDYNEGLFY